MDAIEYFKGMRKILCEEYLKGIPKDSVGYQATLREMSFYDAAIKALEQQPCEDAISRSEAIRIASGYCHWTNIPAELAKLPSVSTEKTGRWIFVDKAKEHAHCSECDYGNVDLFDGRPHNYCPNCGARNEVEE